MANDTTDRLRQIVRVLDDEGGASCVDGEAPYDTTITEVPPHAAKLLTDTHPRLLNKKKVKDDVEEHRTEAESGWTWLS